MKKVMSLETQTRKFVSKNYVHFVNFPYFRIISIAETFYFVSRKIDYRPSDIGYLNNAFYP